MIEILANFLLLLGAAFTLIAALGVARFPDFFCRIHAATKAGAFGGAMIAIATGLALGMTRVWVEITLFVLFYFLTAPIGSHLLGRAALSRGVYRYNAAENG